jgi:hypothetical protein
MVARSMKGAILAGGMKFKSSDSNHRLAGGELDHGDAF